MKLAYTLIITAVLLAACTFNKTIIGNGHLTTLTRQIPNITKVIVNGSIDVELVQGEPGVVISADENLMDYIITDVNNNEIEIHYRDDVNVKTSNNVKVKLSLQNIQSASVSGSGSIVTQGKITTINNVNLQVAGSGNIMFDLNTPAVDADISGSGNIEISGETKDVSIGISGSGKFNSYRLMAESAKVDISGSGEARIFVDAKLDVTVNGSGEVFYKGKAENISQSINGSGSLHKE